MNSRIVVGLFVGFLLSAGVNSAKADVVLSDLVQFGTDSSGTFLNDQFWSAHAGIDHYQLYVIEGGPNGTFLNSGSGSSAGISVDLTNGSYTFTVFGDGLNAPALGYYGLNLFFNGDSIPSISVFAALQTSTSEPSFAADGSSQSPSPTITPYVAAANALTFSSGQSTVTLTDYHWATPALNGLDRVSPHDLGANGAEDYVGQFTLQVSSVPEPSTLTMTSVASLICLAAWKLRCRSHLNLRKLELIDSTPRPL